MNQENLEELTAEFTKLLIKYKLKPSQYFELLHRVKSLVKAELAWQAEKEWDLELMQFWQGERN